ncbi:hypothetical protein [Flavobacterium sp. HTF]|uniref:hypothetical protein n=1 Tax=Flavobacterium sp. HTF TaxID=2170732 RepID=UPI000D5E1614|nr:hypothetical protein [Flavobacterium sp. HTF]PWB24668.1 hypothetical protein DCO46_11165 [Flavobacterium sp. HTF]
MIQTGIKVKSVIVFIKENLSIIIILPALFGGLWQLFELWSIAPSFIRFFSISQIVPDGLFILFLLIYCSLPFLGAHLVHTAIIKDDKTTFELMTLPIIKNKKVKLKVYGLGFLLLTLCGIILYLYSSFIDDTIIRMDMGLILAIPLIAFSNLFLNNCYNTTSPESKYNYKLGNFLLLILYCAIAIYAFKRVHKIRLPRNIANIEYITAVTQKKYPDSKNEILYFNDKFIFFKITDKHKIDKETDELTEKIEILKLDDLFIK